MLKSLFHHKKAVVSGYYQAARRVLRVEGEDAREWLNGQVTCDLREPSAEARNGVVVNLKGKIMSDLMIHDHGDHFDVLIASEAFDAVFARLDKYIVMEDVDLITSEERVLVFEGEAASVPDGAVRFERGFRWLSDAPLADELPRFSDDAREEARLAVGRPSFGADFGEDTLPQEAGLKSYISFEKGCYVGQEPIVMLEHRGKPPKRLVHLRTELPVGATISQEGREVGQVTSSRGGFGIARLKRKALEREAELTSDGPLEVLGVITL